MEMTLVERIGVYIERNPLTTVLGVLLVAVYTFQWRLVNLGHENVMVWMFYGAGWTDPHLLSMITSTIGHASLVHFIGNLCFLLVVGPVVERKLSRASFLLLFFAAGGASGAVQSMLSGGTSIGASGGIAALAAVWVLYELPAYTLPEWMRKLVHSSRILAVIYLVSIPALGILALTPVGPWIFAESIGHIAHAIGFLFGVFTVALLWWKGDRPTIVKAS